MIFQRLKNLETQQHAITKSCCIQIEISYTNISIFSFQERLLWRNLVPRENSNPCGKLRVLMFVAFKVYNINFISLGWMWSNEVIAFYNFISFILLSKSFKHKLITHIKLFMKTSSKMVKKLLGETMNSKLYTWRT